MKPPFPKWYNDIVNHHNNSLNKKSYKTHIQNNLLIITHIYSQHLHINFYHPVPHTEHPARQPLGCRIVQQFDQP